MRLTIKNFVRGERRLAMLTAYDAPTARLVDKAGVDAILVGDSVGNTVQGFADTTRVTLDEIIYHTRMVVRGTERALIIGDMPFMSYQISPEQALTSAGRLIKEGGCQAVKLEGGGRQVDTVMRIVEAGIPVMAHLGLTPQSINAFGGMRAQGRDLQAARQLITDAEDMEAAGAFAVVLEAVPHRLARIVTERIAIPTIGIGAGPDTSGQVLVFHDLFGLLEGKALKHTMVYQNLGEVIEAGVRSYRESVEAGVFPTEANSFTLDPDVEAALRETEPSGLA